MGITLGRNIGSLKAERQLGISTNAVSDSLARLSSGQRINRPSDDPAGLSVALSLNNRARVYTQAVRNVSDGVSALSIADAALGELSGVLTRMTELAEQAANGSLSRIQRLSLDDEAEALRQEFNRILDTTKFNGQSLLNLVTRELGIQAGFGNEGSIRFSLGGELARKIGTGFEDPLSTPALGLSNVSNFILGDVNGDGVQDVVSTSSTGGEVAVSIGRGDGTFEDASVYAVSGANALALGDLNNDGALDIVVGGAVSTFSLLNNGDGTFAAASSLFVGSSTDISLGDLDGDGNLDVVTYSGTSLRISFGDGLGSISSTDTIVSPTNVSSIGLIDSNDDGVLDLAYTNNSFNGIQIRLNDGNASFGSVIQSGNTTNGRIYIADFNFDGLDDIVMDASSSFTTNILLSNGDGSFTVGQEIERGSAVLGMDLGDVDGDGIIDIVWRESASTVSVYKGIGDGTFNDRVSYGGLQTAGNRLRVGDLNGDGVDDLVMRPLEVGEISFYLASTEDSSSLQRFNLTTQEDAQASLDLLSLALGRVTRERGVLGAALSRSDSALNLLTSLAENFKAAESRILDADIAAETANLVRNQILQQSGAAILAQANQTTQLVLSLLDISSN